MTEPQENHQNNQSDIRSLMDQNHQLLQENNELLKKMHRSAVIGFWFRILWFAVMLGLPFVLYFYLLKPYLETFGADTGFFDSAVEQIIDFRESFENPSE